MPERCADRNFKLANRRSAQVFGRLKWTDARRLWVRDNSSRANGHRGPTTTRVAFLHLQSPETYVACTVASMAREKIERYACGTIAGG